MAERPRMTAGDLVDKLLTSEHADVLGDSVAWLVAELMEAEVGGLTGAGLVSVPLIAARPSVTATGLAAGTLGSVSWSWPSPSCGPGRTSRAFWSRAGGPSRRWSRSCRRPMSTASRPARSTGWSSSWGCKR
jgi:hypothetical protein